MFQHYVTTTWRNLLKNRTFSLINISGLGLGMACSLFILLWVNDELAMDTFHAHDGNLYSLYERQYHDGQIDGVYSTPGILADEMKVKLPEVEYATSMAWNALSTFAANDKILKENGSWAGEDFFKMFSYTLVQGDAGEALRSTITIAVSRKMAEDFFGTPKDAIGKSIRYENRKDLTITAVFENIPQESSIKFDYLINWQTFLDDHSWAKDWGNNGPSTYIALRGDTDLPMFQQKIKNFLALYDDQENFRIELDIQRFSERYLHSSFKSGEIIGGRIQYVRIFSIVAVFILVIACINFMNLTTARSVKRAKEIGVRKVVGAVRTSLIRQFLAEAVWISLLAFVLALLIVLALLPAFNDVVQKQISIPFNDGNFWLEVIGISVVTGLLSGSYPALYLSSFTAARVIKGSLTFTRSSQWFRKGLVVFQFVLSILLIIGTLVVTKQVKYIQSVNLGYDRENLLYIPLDGNLGEKYELLKEKCLSQPGITDVTRITETPTAINNGTGGVIWEGKDPNSRLQFVQVAVGYDFAKTMQVEIVQGRDFSNAFTSDSSGYIVNETALEIFNYKDPIGMPLTFWQKKGKIVGVIKDFHFNSMHNAIRPLILRLGEQMEKGYALIRTESGKTKGALEGLGKICKELNPAFPFTYQFSDQEYQKMYRSEEIVTTLTNTFAALAIFISCLGLLGLMMFTTEQRTKEIGIRKILGAGPGSLFALLSTEIFTILGVALVIASPLGWMTMENWLNDYAYRITVAWWFFFLAGITVFGIAVSIVGFQIMRAMLVSPVKSLRMD